MSNKPFFTAADFIQALRPGELTASFSAVVDIANARVAPLLELLEEAAFILGIGGHFCDHLGDRNEMWLSKYEALKGGKNE